MEGREIIPKAAGRKKNPEKMEKYWEMVKESLLKMTSSLS